jgi:Concanavalin A-like lectin/glucanases superfamily
MPWIIIVAPFFIVALVGTLAFLGCELDTEGIPAPELYRDDVFNNPHVVSYWRLDEEGGTTAADSKDGNAGTYEGGVTLGVPGLLQNDADTAVQFDGVSGYVSVPNADALNPAQFTVEAIATIAGGDGTFRVVVSSNAVGGGSSRFGYTLYVSDQNRWEALVGDGSSWNPVSVGQPGAVEVGGGPRRGPYHLAMTYDGMKLTVYVNPVDQNDPDQVASQAFGYQPNTTDELRIGAGALEPPTLFFNGVIDEVAVYNAPLDFNTVKRHFAIQMTGLAPP